jgi:hypothetical protein
MPAGIKYVHCKWQISYFHIVDVMEDITMTKLNEINDENKRRIYLDYVEKHSNFWNEVRNKTLERINGYLFTLNAGALLAALTYIAAKTDSKNIYFSIWAFAIGILCCLLHAGIDYYSVETCLADYSTDVNNLYSNKMEWEEFIANCSIVHKKLDILLHCIGWVSGISFITGLVAGIIQLN